MHHLKDAMFEASEKKEDERRELIGGVVSREELWDCTTCGACVEACPLHIEHIPAIIDMRRYMTMTEGDMPAELQGTLQNLEIHSKTQSKMLHPHALQKLSLKHLALEQRP